MHVIGRVARYLFRYPGLFAATQGLAILMVLLAIAIPRAIERILSEVQASGTLDRVAWGAGVVVALYLGSELFNGLRIVANNTLEQRVLMDMRRDLHRKLLHLPVSFYDQRKSGEISSRVIEDVASVERALLDGTEMGGRAVVTILGVTVMLFLTDPFLAWFVFLPLPVLLVVGWFYSRASKKYWSRVREAAGDLNSLLVEDIQGNRLIQTFGLQRRESARFEDRADKLRRHTLRAMYRWSIYGPGTSFLSNLGTVAIIALGGYLMVSRPESFGFPQLVSFLMYANLLYAQLDQLHSINHLVSAGKASGERVFEVLDAPTEVAEPPQPKPFPEGAVGLRFEQVGFQYPGRPAVLDGFVLDLAPGTVTALVGHTGAGKSTVANLAMRAYDVTSGRITLNGVDLRELGLNDLRTRIGHVAQDPFLFEGTVRENLLLAREDAPEEAIIRALQGASAWEFVVRLPQGLDTNIGEKGIRLSQGEKQRLTIARVLLRNPPLVILDEATASVDTITERQIQEALDTLMRDRTVLVIAHRLSTVRKADRIVVLDKGRILEQGTHEALLAREGHYARLWQYQSDWIPE